MYHNLRWKYFQVLFNLEKKTDFRKWNNKLDFQNVINYTKNSSSQKNLRYLCNLFWCFFPSTSLCSATPSSLDTWPVMGLVVILRRRMLIIRKLEIQQNEDEKSNDGSSDDEFYVLKPKLILQFSGLLFKLRCSVLQRVRTLIQLGQFGVPF